MELAVDHLEHAPEAIVSFGQGCEGEPLTEYSLIADCIRDMRAATSKGTINLNTNGSWPERIRMDSVFLKTISMSLWKFMAI